MLSVGEVRSVNLNCLLKFRPGFWGKVFTIQHMHGNVHPRKLIWNPQNWWFVDISPFATGYFQVPAVGFRGCNIFQMG